MAFSEFTRQALEPPGKKRGQPVNQRKGHRRGQDAAFGAEAALDDQPSALDAVEADEKVQPPQVDLRTCAM